MGFIARILQDDLIVAEIDASSIKQAEREIEHYAMVYSQDGEIVIERKYLLPNSELAKFQRKVRRAFANYTYSEGCSCCRDYDSHIKHAKVLGKLLDVEPYDDGSGYNFNKYRSKKLKQ